MTRIDYPLETGPDGQAATTANAGNGTTAAQQVTPGSGGTIIYRTAAAAPTQSFGLRFSNGANAACVARWNAAAANNQMPYRVHISGPFGGTPTAEVSICGYRHSGGNVATLRWQTNNSCNFNDGNGSLVGTILPAGSDPTVIYGWTLVINNSTGAYTLKCYLPNGTVAGTLSGTRTWSSTAAFNAIQLGILTAHAQALNVNVDYPSMDDGSSAEIAPLTSGGGSTPANVNALAATATATAPTPKYDVTSSTDGGGPAAASATAPAPAVSADALVEVAAATASATGVAPTVAAQQVATVTAPAASATATALPPLVGAGGSVQVTSPAAIATATAPAPAVTGNKAATVQAVAATAAAASAAPSVAASSNLAAATATASAQAVAPTLTALRNPTLQALAAAATATALVPLITGSNANDGRPVANPRIEFTSRANAAEFTQPIGA